jgi:delta1-piperideine-2-carboxylate reductase
MEGVRMPGARRHKNRLDKGTRKIDPTLLKTIRELS